ncbi:hypothetical protein ACHAWF_004871 [Thalassiosira exigua]
MASSAPAEPPRFRLLLHGQDGSIPYLTPELTRLVFCPEGSFSGEGDDPADSVEDWKWRRRHFVLGVAVKDTCVTAVYRDASATSKRKRKADGGGNRSVRPAKKVKTERPPSDAPPSCADASVTPPSVAATAKAAAAGEVDGAEGEEKNSVNNAKKPAGYTFLDPDRSSQICSEINAHLRRNTSPAPGRGDDKVATTYMHTHLRIPRYISTMIVPTFSLDCPGNKNGSAREGTGNGDAVEKEKKYVPKKQTVTSNNKQKQRRQQPQRQRGEVVIPGSTKNSMPVDTPNGWQKIRPEQYWDAVTSLAQPHIGSESKTGGPDSSRDNACEGAVGLFDRMDVACDRLDWMLEESGGDDDSGGASGPQTWRPASSPEGLTIRRKWSSSLRRLVQRTNEWSRRSQIRRDEMRGRSQSEVDFWTPVHLAASQLALASLFSRPISPKPTESWNEQLLADCHKVAIVGWDAIGNDRGLKRRALHSLVTTIRSSPTPPKQYLVLSVSDVQSMLDAAREGISIIGTDAVRQWSRGSRALCLDLESGDTDNNARCVEAVDGMINLRDERYSRDSTPLLSGCQCVTCRVRQRGAGSGGDKRMGTPFFSRAYIHHLIKAKEMLAETLLFMHNLHHTLLLFRQLSKAASLDDSDEDKGNLEAFCQGIEKQLA